MQTNIKKFASIFAKIFIFSLLLTGVYGPQTTMASVGQLDTTFNTVGYVTHDSAAGGSGSNDYGRSLQIQSDGKYVITGYGKNATGNEDMIIWRYNTDGTLDTTFNTVGYVAHDNAAGGSSDDWGLSLQVQSDGKYVVAGQSKNMAGNYDLAVWRYNSDGTLDTTFNTVGYVTHGSAAGGTGADCGTSIQIQSDGKYVVAGSSTNVAADYDLAVWRYNTDGTLDTTFNTVGYATHHNAAGANSYDWGDSMQIQSDGKYVISGASYNADWDSDLIIWRYNTDGTLDTTFNTVGYVVYDSIVAGSNDEGISLQIQSDGKYIIAGYDTNSAGGNLDQAIWRYNTDGTLDTTFNTVGYNSHNSAAGGNHIDIGNDLQIQSDGKYVISGYSKSATGSTDLAIWRYNSDGTLDTTFNTVGYITYDSATGGSDNGLSLQTQSGEKYVTTGYSTNAAGNNDMAIWKYENLYQIVNLDATLDAEASGANIDFGSANGVYGTATVSILKSTVPIADVQAAMTVDRDWTTVLGNTDGTSYKSFINMTSAEGVSGTYILYVPRNTGENSVGICPDVSSLAAVSNSCTNLEYRSVNNSSVTVTTVGGNEYFQITELGNTGGFSSPNNLPTNTQIDSSNSDTIPENSDTTNIGTLTTTDLDIGDTHTFSLTCTVPGADDGYFTISSDQLQNTSIFDYENPADTNKDNIYEVCIVTNDGNGGLYEETITIIITDISDTGGGIILPRYYPPAITSNGGDSEANISINEIGTFVTTIESKASGETLEYSIHNGDDKALFTIDSETGELNFITSPDYENPSDKNGDNIYEVVVRVDNTNSRDMQTIYVTVTRSSHSFVDIADHWAEEHIEYLYYNDIIQGKIFSEFMPEDKITRAEFVKMVLKVFSYQISRNKDGSFSDVEPDTWYTPYINTGYKEGIINGYSNKTFEPNKNITQAEALKILLLSAEFEIDETEVQTEEWYDKYINTAIKEEVITKFSTPKATISRAEVASMLAKILSTGEVKWDIKTN